MGVLGEFEDAFVEREPAAFAVQEAALRELGAAGLGLLRLLVRVEVGVDVGFQVGDRGRDRVGAVGGDGAHGGLGVLRSLQALGVRGLLRVGLGLGLRLAHGPIVPRREHDGRVGKRGRERGGRAGVSVAFRAPLRGWRRLWHDGLHSASVASSSESMVTGT